jgi:hypothetical protein
MLKPSQVVDTYFLESRHQLLEIAAYLDRYDAAVARNGNANGHAADEKKLAVREMQANAGMMTAVLPTRSATVADGCAKRTLTKDIAPKAKDFTNKRAYRNCPLTDADKETNRRKSSVRSKIEHPFLTLKRLWGFAKVRYRGLAKKANRAFAMLATLNVNKWGRPLTGEVRQA